MARAKQDGGQDEVQATVENQEEKGHIGEKPGGFPNDAFSLESGPDSPSALEQKAAALDQRAEQVRASTGSN